MTSPEDQVALVARILAAYGVQYDHILPPQQGYRNQSFGIVRPPGTTLNLMLYKSEPGMLGKLRAANAVGDYLAGRGFPARRTFSPKVIRLRSGARAKYGALYEYLSGSTIPWEAYTKRHIKLLGKTMSDMHAALANFPGTNALLPDVADEYLAILSRMRRYFADEPALLALDAKLQLGVNQSRLAAFEKLLLACRQLRHQQPLHMDFVRSNILFENGASDSAGRTGSSVVQPEGLTSPLRVKRTARPAESDARKQQIQISGILDFEKTAIGHPLFDVARTLAFLLVDCKYKSEADVRKLFLESGYNRRGAATLPGDLTAKLLEPLLDLFLFYDFYKFLRHNPYEALPCNQHFVRTKQLLARRGLLYRLAL